MKDAMFILDVTEEQPTGALQYSPVKRHSFTPGRYRACGYKGASRILNDLSATHLLKKVGL